MDFATTDELAAYTGRAIENTAQADLAINLASGMIRAETGQTITLVVDDVVTLRGGSHSQLVLPERPVVGVSSVAGEYVHDDEWTWHGEYLSRVYGWPELVTVTYSHGFAAIPTDVKAITLALAARALAANAAEGEVASETIGNYSVTYTRGTYGGRGATPASGLMLDSERDFLRRTYRRSASMASLR